VDGAKSGTGVLNLNLSAHTRVRAIFSRVVTVTDFSDTAGSAAAPTLRYALANAEDDDIITFSGVTAIVLEAPCL
jgi:hypothetical protein